MVRKIDLHNYLFNSIALSSLWHMFNAPEKGSSIFLEHFSAYVNNVYVEEYGGGIFEDAWLYHKCSK